MAFFSALLSIIHILFLLLIPPLVFLWIIGKLKELRLQNQQQYQQPTPQPLSTHPQPSPTNIQLEPRRLSFSTPTPLPKRRVTFSLTPEQQANELLKTAVRRRESLPTTNLLLPTHSPITQLNTHPQQVAHLFPSQNPPNFHFNPSRTPSVFPSFQQQPFHPPQPQKPRPKPSNPAPPALHKRKTSPNKNQNPLSKRQRNPTNKPSRPRPSSPPVYAADLRREPKQHNFDNHAPQLNKSSYPSLQQDPSPERRPADSPVLNPAIVQEPGVKRRRTPPSDKKPPKPPRLGAIPNGFAPQPSQIFPTHRVTRVTQNGVITRAVR